MRAIRWDLYADRGRAFSDSLAVVGEDFTAAALQSQVRNSPDAPGAPILTLTVSLTYGGTDTVANHVSAGRLPRSIYDFVNASTGANYLSTDTVAMSVLSVAVTDTATGVPAGNPLGSAVKLAWDLLIAGQKRVFGDFWVSGVVTQ